MELDTSIDARGATFHFSGRYDPEFQGVADAFVENLRVEDEIGAACLIMQNGRTIVDSTVVVQRPVKSWPSSVRGRTSSATQMANMETTPRFRIEQMLAELEKLAVSPYSQPISVNAY